MEAVNHRFGVLQQQPTSLVVRCPHVHTIAQHLVALLGREQLQARRGRLFVAARLHRQHRGILGIAQVGHDRHIQLVAFLQTDLIHAEVRDGPLWIDHERLTFGQLILDDETHCFR
jgi:hypothetical protein